MRDFRIAIRQRIDSDTLSRRAAVGVFVVVAAASVPLRFSSTHGAWFTVDDWDFLAQRRVGNLGDLFRAHYEHWSTLIVLAYRALWSAFGLHYRPYELFAIALYLAVAALARVVMRRAGVGPWTATFAASLLVLLGIGIENNFFTSAFAFGLTQLLLADHEGPLDWRDYLALAAGLAALMSSGLGTTMVFVVGVAMLLRHGWRIALLQTAPLAAIYLIWLAAAPNGQSASSLHAQGLGDVVSFVARGLRRGLRSPRRRHGLRDPRRADPRCRRVPPRRGEGFDVLRGRCGTRGGVARGRPRVPRAHRHHALRHRHRRPARRRPGTRTSGAVPRTSSRS